MATTLSSGSQNMALIERLSLYRGQNQFFTSTIGTQPNGLMQVVFKADFTFTVHKNSSYTLWTVGHQTVCVGDSIPASDLWNQTERTRRFKEDCLPQCYGIIYLDLCSFLGE